jgi:hypothetical protein
MARGQVGATEKQLGKTNAVAADEGNKANKLESQLIPGYTSLMDTGYFNPAEEAAATTSEMGATAAPFSSAEFEGRNRAAATRNPADVTAQSDQLAMEEGRAAGDTAAHLQDQKMNNQEAGMYGLGQLQSGDRSAEMSMYGLGPASLNARAAGGGWSQGFHDVATGVGSVMQGIGGMGGHF